MTFDVVRLYGVEGKTLVEIYSRIPTGVLTFKEADGRWESSLAFDLTVTTGDSVVLRDSWTRKKTVADRRMLAVYDDWGEWRALAYWADLWLWHMDGRS